MAENADNLQNQQQLNKSIEEYRSLLKEITAEYGKQENHTASAIREYRKLDSLAKQLQHTEEGINGISSEQLKKLQEKSKFSIKEIESQAKQLLAQKQLQNLDKDQLADKLRKLALDEKESSLLRAYLDDFESEKKFLSDIEEATVRRIFYEERVKSLTGATGAILDSMNDTMQELGLGALSQYLEIDKAKKAMQEEADAIARGEKEGGKLQVRMAGLKILAEGFTKALFSTESILRFIGQQLTMGSQNMADFRKHTGMSYESAYKLNMEMKGIAAASMDNFITSDKLNKSYAMLTSELGVSADILGGEALVSATNLEQRLGMSAEQAGKLTVFARLQGKATEDILSTSAAVVGKFNDQNRTAINGRAVLEDVASASMATYLNMDKNVESLTEAAVKAKALGLSMKQLEQISDNLLDFQDSIGKELEAQLLTGGDINLAKAREYALTGDMKGLTDEIQKQEGILNAFRTKNVIAQKAAADALGISREELANMALQQDFATMSAENFKEAYGETTYESMKARSATEKFQDVLEKIKDILGSILQGFSPILDLIAGILNIPLVPYILAAVVASKALGFSVTGIGKAFGSMYKIGSQAVTGLAGMFKKGALADAVGGLKDKLTGGFAAGKAGKVGEKAGDMLGQVGDKSKTLNPAAGSGIRGFFVGLGQGFVAFAQAMAVPTPLGPVGLVMAVAMAAITASIIGLGFALKLAAPGIEAFGKVVTAAFNGLATIITAVADGFVKILGAVTLGNVGAMLGLGPALAGVAVGIGALGLASTLSAPGIIVTGLALQMMTPGLLAINEAAQNFTIGALATQLSTLASSGAGLASVAASLYAIAGGLGAISVTGGLAIPIFASMGLLATAITPLVAALGFGKESAGGAKKEGEKGTLAGVEAKLDMLIAVAKQGTNVYLDGKKVSTHTQTNMIKTKTQGN